MDRQGNSFGTRLKTLRMGTGKTQLEIAEELTERYPDFAISQANISHLEREKQRHGTRCLKFSQIFWRSD